MLTFEQMLTPIWDTDIVYGESLTMIKQPNGLCEAPLLFEAEEVIEVCSADCKNVVIPDNITEIGETAFAECSEIESVVIPDSVTKINKEAFISCSNLVSVVLPDGLM